jgi:hypothetical protein
LYRCSDAGGSGCSTEAMTEPALTEEEEAEERPVLRAEDESDGGSS